MTKKVIFALVVACSGGFAACDSSPTDAGRPQYDVHARRTTTTTTTTSTAATSDTANATQSGGQIGDPCDPATYSGPYRCIPDPNNQLGGYIIAY